MSIELKVFELTENIDYGRNIARIDSEFMKKINVRVGDIIEIEGTRKTVAIAINSYSIDTSFKNIRIDDITRRNAGIDIGEMVKIRKIEIKEARSVTLTPIEKDIIVQVSPTLVRQYLCKKPIMKGDIIMPSPIVKRGKNSSNLFDDFFGPDFMEMFFTPFSGSIKFIVLETIPKGAVMISDKTDLKIEKQLRASSNLNLTLEDTLYKKLICVKKKPNIKIMIEVKTEKDIEKLSKNSYINKYENKSEIIYFVENWYYKKYKEKEKL